MPDHPHITAPTPEPFRRWLEANHASATGVWLIYAKKGSGEASIRWSEAVDEALCFGWIDSKVRPIDDQHYEQYFTQRKPTSPWSRVNKAKIERLQRAGRLEAAGVAAVAAAKQNGAWIMLDDAEALIVPDDLASAMTAKARKYFETLAPSRRRNVLQWIILAKRDDTRARRIAATATAAAEGTAPNNI